MEQNILPLIVFSIYIFISISLLITFFAVDGKKRATILFAVSLVFQALLVLFPISESMRLLALLYIFFYSITYLCLYFGVYIQPQWQINKDKKAIRNRNRLISFEFKEMNDLLYFRFHLKSALLKSNASRISNIDSCTVQSHRKGKQITLQFEKPIVGKKYTYYWTIPFTVNRSDFVERFSCKEIQFTCSKKDAKTIADTLKVNGIEVNETP